MCAFCFALVLFPILFLIFTPSSVLFLNFFPFTYSIFFKGRINCTLCPFLNPPIRLILVRVILFTVTLVKLM